jgi:hypothetical protein
MILLIRRNDGYINKSVLSLTKSLVYKSLSTMQNDLLYIIDQCLSRHLSNYIVQPLSLPLRVALFGGNMRITSHIGFKRNRMCKQIGTRHC